MPITSYLGLSNGRGRSAILSSSRRTIRSSPGAGGCSTSLAVLRGSRPAMAVEIGDFTVAIATIALTLHIVSAVVWVGGMFFALMVLRPASGPLDPPARLALWQRVFDRFFPWVIAAIALLLVSGYAMVFEVFGGFAGIGLHVHLMQATGIVMILIFLHLY